MELYIIGCGGNSKVVIDMCKLNGYNIIGCFDDKYKGHKHEFYQDIHVIGKIKDILNYSSANIVNSIGDIHTRKRIFDLLESHTGLNWINCRHPQSYISPTVKLGRGNIICYGSMINAATLIGDFNLINTYSIIEHDCSIGDFNHFAPKVALCGGITVGNFNLFGVGSSIIPNKKIGNKNVIAAMSVIINDYDSNHLITGIPGKLRKT